MGFAALGQRLRAGTRSASIHRLASRGTLLVVFAAGLAAAGCVADNTPHALSPAFDQADVARNDPGSNTVGPVPRAIGAFPAARRLYFATNRFVDETSGTPVFTPDRTPTLRVGTVDVGLPSPGLRPAQRDACRLEPGGAGCYAVDPGAVTIGPPQVEEQVSFDRAGPYAQDGGGALLFVHGFNVSFRDGAVRLAQIVTDLGYRGKAVLFSWPSVGASAETKRIARERGWLSETLRFVARGIKGVPYYFYDQESATYSREALAGVIERLIRDNAGRGVTVIAHSLGNWPTLEALRIVRQRAGVLERPTIDACVFASGDVDIDVFSRQLPQVREICRSVLLCTARDDGALRASQQFHLVPRIGNPYGEETFAEVNMILPDSISDLSAYRERGLNHGKCFTRREGLAAIAARLSASNIALAAADAP